MFCVVCAAVNAESREQCAQCGAPLPTANRPNTVGNIQQPLGSARRGRRRLARSLLMLPLVLAVVAGGVVAGRLRWEQAGSAAAYARAEHALAAGDYEAAITAFGEAGGFRDAPVRRAEAIATVAPYRAAYHDGIAALDAGRYAEAIATLLPVAQALPGYEDVLDRLEEARDHQEIALARQAEIAISRRDWLAADLALSALLSLDPENADAARRLNDVRRTHAPLVFTRNGAIMVIGPDLLDERLVMDDVPAAAPTWSPDRSRIAFYSPNTNTDFTAKLYVVNADGSNLRLLANEARMDWWPAWSPDGSKIAFVAIQPGEERRKALAKTTIRVVDVATGSQTDITSRQITHVSPPSWSPRGDRLAFAGFSLVSDYALGTIQRRNGAVFIATLATGELERISNNQLANAVLVAWSPARDEDLLVYLYETTGVGFDRQKTGILLLNPVTGNMEKLTQRSPDVGPPFWAPDGSRFAFIEGDSVVRIRWLPGRREAAIGVARPVVMLTWAPDGQALLVVPVDVHQPATIIPLPDGPGTQADVLIPFDFAISGAGPQWSPVNPLEPLPPPTIGGTALDPPGMVAAPSR